VGLLSRHDIKALLQSCKLLCTAVGAIDLCYQWGTQPQAIGFISSVAVTHVRKNFWGVRTKTSSQKGNTGQPQSQDGEHESQQLARHGWRQALQRDPYWHELEATMELDISAYEPNDVSQLSDPGVGSPVALAWGFKYQLPRALIPGPVHRTAGECSRGSDFYFEGDGYGDVRVMMVAPSISLDLIAQVTPVLVQGRQLHILRVWTGELDGQGDSHAVSSTGSGERTSESGGDALLRGVLWGKVHGCSELLEPVEMEVEIVSARGVRYAELVIPKSSMFDPWTSLFGAEQPQEALCAEADALAGIGDSNCTSARNQPVPLLGAPCRHPCEKDVWQLPVRRVSSGPWTEEKRLRNRPRTGVSVRASEGWPEQCAYAKRHGYRQFVSSGEEDRENEQRNVLQSNGVCNPVVQGTIMIATDATPLTIAEVEDMLGTHCGMICPRLLLLDPCESAEWDGTSARHRLEHASGSSSSEWVLAFSSGRQDSGRRGRQCAGEEEQVNAYAMWLQQQCKCRRLVREPERQYDGVEAPTVEAYRAVGEAVIFRWRWNNNDGDSRSTRRRQNSPMVEDAHQWCSQLSKRCYWSGVSTRWVEPPQSQLGQGAVHQYAELELIPLTMMQHRECVDTSQLISLLLDIEAIAQSQPYQGRHERVAIAKHIAGFI
jgi:hypothetical protein